MAEFDCISVKGVVWKDAVEREVWVERDAGQPHYSATRRLRIEDSHAADGSLRIWVMQDESVSVKVGQTHHVIANRTSDGFETATGNCPKQQLSALE